MNYTSLLSFVNTELHPNYIRSHIDQLDHYQQKVTSFQDEISKELQGMASNVTSAATLQDHQTMLTQISNSLFNYSKFLVEFLPATNNSVLLFYEKITKVFDDLLYHIIKNYPAYVLRDLPVPYSFGSVIRKEFQSSISELQAASAQNLIEPALLELILRPIIDIIQRKEQMVTSGVLFYNRTLLNELTWITQKSSSEIEINAQIHYTLLHLNFNSFEYYFFCTNKLRQKLQEKKDKKELLEFLTFYEKEIKATPYKSNDLILHQDQQSLSTQMLTWIAKEKEYVEFLHNAGQIEVLMETEQENEEEEEVDSNEIDEESNTIEVSKLNTDLTVRELAVMVKLYIDVGIIIKTTQTKVMHFITQMLTTKRTKSLAFPSFKNKFHNKPSLKTLVKCEWWLKKLLAKIEEYKREIAA
ncbi:hypothetical protein [Chitinophaga niabensis]|uniref:Uncharacterized protein n=1 Tax=Chitinophaga niabensis TaxID=536979 RepID=A0A1N6KAZ7_9BACT|nr:hypothetical protein [Chitinophaga niabensis]SIO53764.1 hypothetical protein SAMN04488055_5475 [Chitinophaga niabensis]